MRVFLNKSSYYFPNLQKTHKNENIHPCLYRLITTRRLRTVISVFEFYLILHVLLSEQKKINNLMKSANLTLTEGYCRRYFTLNVTSGFLFTKCLTILCSKFIKPVVLRAIKRNEQSKKSMKPYVWLMYSFKSVFVKN